MDVLADVLAATKLGGVVTTHLIAAAPWGIRMDDVPTATFHAVVAGACWLIRPGAEPLALAAGDFVLLPTGTGHALCSAPRAALAPASGTEGGTGRQLVRLAGPGPQTTIICGAYRYDAFPGHPLQRLLPGFVHIRADRELAATVALLEAEFAADRPGAQTITDRLVDIMFVRMLRAWAESRAEAGATWLAALRDPEISAALALLHADPAHAWTVRELAERVGVARATLARRFTALVGEPPLAYLGRWRLGLAAAAARYAGCRCRRGQERRLRLGIRVLPRLQAGARLRARGLSPRAAVTGFGLGSLSPPRRCPR
ncbi:cupin domain-containing protein [Nocardia sp. NPDC048505]|uniref:cupin domain-containing protein n=1 Tax=unclassified Nocardia TaxID=2637762 RepID=UPI00340120F2